MSSRDINPAPEALITIAEQVDAYRELSTHLAYDDVPAAA